MKKTAIATRLLSGMMILCLLIGMIPGAGMTARAEGGTWEYRILDSGDAEITGYTDKSASALTIPLSLGGAWVRSVSAGALAELSGLRNVTVPASVTDFGPGAFPADTTLRAYQGAQAHAHARAAGLPSADISAYDFMPSILDLSDMPSSLWSMTGSSVRIGQPFACLISEGSQLYLPPKGEYGQGRPVLVQAMETEGDAAVLTVCDLAFADAIASFSARDVELIPDYSSFVPAAGVSVGQNGLAASSRGEGQGLPVSVVFDMDAVQISVTANISLNGGKTSVEYNNMALQSFTGDFKVTAKNVRTTFSVAKDNHFTPGQAGAGFDKDTGWQISETTKKIGDIELYTAYAFIHVNAALYVRLKGAMVEFTLVTQQIDAEATVSWTKADGLNYDTNWNATPVSFGDAKIDARFGFQLEFSITLGFSHNHPGLGTQMALYVKVASAKIFLGYHASAVLGNETPCVDVYLDFVMDLSAEVGWVESEGFGIFDSDYSTQKSSLTAKLEKENVIRLPMVHRHWEKCEVWQDYCTYNDTTTFYFKTMCEDVIDPVEVKKGETPTAPRAPQWEDHTFAGWYEDEAYTMPWSPAPIEEPAKVIYAKWTQDRPTPTPSETGGPTPTPAPEMEVEIDGSLVSIPYHVFPIEEMPNLLSYRYDAAYGGYIVTGLDTSDYDVYDDRRNFLWNTYSKGAPWTLIIPDYLNGIPVVGVEGAISDGAIWLPDTAKYLNSSFARMYILNVPDSLEDVGYFALYQCTFVTPNLVLPATLKHVGEGAFSNTNIESVVFQGEGIVIDGGATGAFSGTTTLKKVDLGNAVVSIGQNAFNPFDGGVLEEVRLSASLQEMAGSAFGFYINRLIIEARNTPLTINVYSWKQIQTLEFTAGTRDIDVYCPGSLVVLGEIIIPDGVTSISCLGPIICNESEKIIDLPDTLVRIGKETDDWNNNGFAGSNCIREVNLPENVRKIEAGSFNRILSLRNFTFNHGLKYIDDNAFYECGNLRTINAFPDTLEKIGEDAFWGCPLRKIIFPDSNKSPNGACKVGAYAFWANHFLEEIYVPGDLIVEGPIFSLSPRRAYVTCGSEFAAYMEENHPNTELIYHEPGEFGDDDESREYTVTFDTRGLARVESIKVAAGKLIPVPEDPVGDSRQFTGWYKDSHCLHPWNFGADVMPAENITLYAGWRYVFTSTYLLDQEEIILTQLINPEADVTVPSVYDGKKVVGLGANCVPPSVVNLTLPATIRSLDPAAFANASGLQSISVDGENAHFSAVDGVLYAADGTLVCYPQARTGAEFTAARGTTALAENAFCRVQHLNALTLPEGVKTIGSGAFNGCEALGSVSLAGDVTSVADDAVLRCSPAFYGPAGAAVLTAWADKNSMLYNCYSLICISLEEVALAIPVRAGEKLPEIPTTDIGLQHVSGWSRNRKGTQPWNFATDVMPAENLTLYAVWSYDFSWEENDYGVTLTSYNGSSTTVIIPHDINGRTVTAIADDCFAGVTGQSLENGLTARAALTLVDDTGSIAEQYAADKGFAFQRRVYTVNYLTDGGSKIAASSASAGDPIPLPEAPKKNNYAFSSWFSTSLGTVTENSVMPGEDLYLKAQYNYVGGEESADCLIWEERDGEIIITGCTAYGAVTVPSVINGLPVTAIADNAFSGLTIWTLGLPESIKTIGEGAFRDCAELSAITIPSGVTALRKNTFFGCLKLTTVNLPEGLTTIEENALGRCLSLTNVTLPASVRSVSPRAFSGSSALQAIYAAPANKAYTAESGVLFSKDKTTLVIYPGGRADESYTVPSGVKTIGEYAMQSSRLKELYLPTSVTTIGEGALQLSDALETLMLPSGGKLESIGDYAFTGCRSLKSLKLPAALKKLGSYAFANTAVKEVRVGSAVQIGENAFTGLDALVMYGTKNTDAHRWAKEENVRFIDEAADVPVKTITVQAEAALSPGGALTLKPVTAPANATEKFTVTYTSSKPYVASVDEKGVITAHMDGVAVITARAAAGVTAECVVTVRRDEIPMEGITLSVTSLILREGESVPVSWAVFPANATTGLGGSPVWKSSNEKVIRWDEKTQKVIAAGLGDAVLTVTLDNGMRETVTVSVQRRLTLPAGLKTLEAEAFMGGGFTHVILPAGLKSIGAKAFAGCARLTEVYIPSTVTEIAADAFEGSAVTIVCEKGSAAEAFAGQQGLKYRTE